MSTNSSDCAEVQWPQSWQESDVVEVSQNGRRLHYVGREGDFQPLLGENSLVYFGDPICVTANASVPDWSKLQSLDLSNSTKQTNEDGHHHDKFQTDDDLCYYFEIQTRSLVFGGQISIGFSPHAGPVQVGAMPGETPGSIGLHSDGEAYIFTDPTSPFRGQPISPPFELNQVVGCGIILKTNEVFFTMNGKKLEATFQIDVSNHLYPIVGMESVGSVIDANFGPEGFLWEGNVVNSLMPKRLREDELILSNTREDPTPSPKDKSTTINTSGMTLQTGKDKEQQSAVAKPMSPLLRRLLSGKDGMDEISDLNLPANAENGPDSTNTTEVDSGSSDSGYDTDCNSVVDDPPAKLDADLAARTVDRFSKSVHHTVRGIKETFASFLHTRQEQSAKQQRDLSRAARLEEDLKVAQAHLELLSQVVYNKLQESGALDVMHNTDASLRRTADGRISPAGLYKASIRAAEAAHGSNVPTEPGSLAPAVPVEVVQAALGMDKAVTSLPPELVASLARSMSHGSAKSSGTEVQEVENFDLQPSGFTQELAESCERIQVRLMNLIRESGEEHVLDYLLKLHDKFDYLLNMHRGLYGAIERLGSRNIDSDDADKVSKRSSIGSDAKATLRASLGSDWSASSAPPREGTAAFAAEGESQSASGSADEGTSTGRGARASGRREPTNQSFRTSGTSSIQQLLSMLRTGNAQEQTNAATALSYLVKEQAYNTAVLKAGGIHILTRLYRSSSAGASKKLRAEAVRAIASIVSSSCVPVRQYVAGTSAGPAQSPMLSPHQVACYFEEELAEIIGALGWLLEEQKRALLAARRGGGQEAADTFQQACTQHAVALAFANLCLVFSYRDNIAAGEPGHSPQGRFRRRGMSEGETSVDSVSSAASGFAVGQTGPELPDVKRAKQPERGMWAVHMAHAALPYLVSICNTGFPEVGGKGRPKGAMAEAMFSGRNEWQEASRLAAFSLAQIAQHQSARAAMIERNVLSPLVAMLKSADSELVLHSVTAVAALCSQGDGASVNEWEVYLFGIPSSQTSSAQVFALGYITAQIITSKIIQPLIRLASSSEVVLGVRGWVAAAIASLATRPQARNVLLAESAIPGLLNLAKLALAAHEDPSSHLRRAAPHQDNGVLSPEFAVLDSAASIGLDRSSSPAASRRAASPAGDGPAAADPPHPALNAGNTELRRRLSNQSFSSIEEMLKRKLVVAQSSLTGVAEEGGQVPDIPRSQVPDGRVRTASTSGLQCPRVACDRGALEVAQCPSTWELRHIAAALYHLTAADRSFDDAGGSWWSSDFPTGNRDGPAAPPSGLHALLVESSLDVLVSLAACDDPLVQLYSVRTLASLSTLGPGACQLLIDSGAAPVLMLHMTAGLARHMPPPDDGLLRPGLLERVLKELRLQSSMTLGNVANSGAETRLKILRSGGASRVLDVVKELLRVVELDRGERLATAAVGTGQNVPDRPHDMDHDLLFSACDTEVLHQAVRTMAGLCEALVAPAEDPPARAEASCEPRTPQYQRQGTCNEAKMVRTERASRRPSGTSAIGPEFGRHGEAVHLLIYLVRNVTAEVVLCQACRALAASARIPGVVGSAHRSEIASEVLDSVVNLAMGGRGHMDRELRRTAESVLVALGFENGCEDLQVCNNDVQGLRDWFEMDHALEKQQMVDAALHTVAASTWLVPIGSRDLPAVESMFESDLFSSQNSPQPGGLPRHSKTFDKRFSSPPGFVAALEPRHRAVDSGTSAKLPVRHALSDEAAPDRPLIAAESPPRSASAAAKVSQQLQFATPVSEPSQFKTIVSEPSQSASIVSEPSQFATIVSEPSQFATIVSEPSQSASIVPEPSQSATKVSEPSQSATKEGFEQQVSLKISSQRRKSATQLQRPSNRKDSGHSLLGLPDLTEEWNKHSVGWTKKVRRLVSCGAGEFISEEDFEREGFHKVLARPAPPSAFSRAPDAVESLFVDGQHVKWYLESALRREHLGEGNVYRVSEEASLAHRPGTRGVEEVPPYWVTLQLQIHFPSVLHRRQLYSPRCYFSAEDAATGAESLLPSKPRAILLPPRTYFSFRFERIIGRILARNSKGGESALDPGGAQSGRAPYAWSLVLRDSKFFGDFFKRLVYCLYRYPTITSICFTSKPGSQRSRSTESDDAFAQLLSDLPPRVNWCTFDNVLTKQAVQLIALIIQTRRNCCIAGLAIRNHGFSLADLRPVVKLLRMATRQNEQVAAFSPGSLSDSDEADLWARPPASPHNAILQRQALRWVDLSGNSLGDVGCAAIVRALAKEECMLEAVDLSRNHVGHQARELMDALVGPTGPGSGCGLVNANCTLRSIHLCENGLGPRAISRLLLGLGSQHKLACRLAVLNLDANAMHGSDRTYAQAALSVLLRNNQTLREIGLCNANLDARCGDEIRKALLENKEIHFLRLEGNPNLELEDLVDIERHLMRNRREWSEDLDFENHQDEVHLEKWTNSSDDGCSDDPLVHGVDHQPAAHQDEQTVTTDLESKSNYEPEKRVLPSSANSITLESTDTIQSAEPAERNVNNPKNNTPDNASSLTQKREQGTSTEVRNTVHSSTEGVKVSRPKLDIALEVPAAPSSTPSSTVVPPRLSVLFSAPLAMRDNENNYYPIDTLDFEVEKELLWQSFVDASREIDISFGFATSERLRSEVTMRCRAIHLSGHGNPNWLSFEDGRGGLHVLTPENVRQLCAAGGQRDQSAPRSGPAPSVQFVFVSACYSEFAGNAFVEAGIPHVVCVDIDNGKLLDKAAQVFTRAFYLSVAVGDSILNAFEIAREAVAVSPSHAAEESRKFKLLPETANHDVPLFPACNHVARWPSVRCSSAVAGPGGVCDQWRGGFLPNRVEDFLGRNVEMYKTLTYILNRRLVTLTGPSGIGKTALAVATANYAAERGLFPDGVIYVRVEDVGSVDDLLVALHNIACSNARSTPGDLRRIRTEPPGELETEDRLDDLCTMLRNRKCLLLLDHIDHLIDQQFEQVRHFVGRLLDNTRGMRILLTTCGEIGIGGLPGYPEAVNQVEPLKPRDSVKLFVRLSPHNHPLGNLDFRPVGMDSLDTLSQSFDLLDVMAGDERVTRLGGHPGRLVEFAYQTSKEDFVQLVEECREKLRHELAQIVSSVPTL